MRSVGQDLGHQPRIGVEVFTRTDLPAAAIPCPIDDLQRKTAGLRAPYGIEP